MVGRALSVRVKRLLERQSEDAKYHAAVVEYQAELLKPPSQRIGARRVADKHGIKWRTVLNHAHGKMSMSEFNALKQKLSPPEERVLVDFLLGSSDRGFALTRPEIETHADAIILGRDEPGELVGKTWVGKFLDRHHQEIQTHWSTPLAMERACSLNGPIIRDWFEGIVKPFVVTKHVNPKNIYGMDESPFPKSNQGTRRVVGRRGTKRQHKVGNANRENVTAIVTICADGSFITPNIIFKGKNILQKWGDDNISDASISVSEKGWTDSDLAMQWMKHDFEPATREKANGNTRLLFIDGHSSHYSADLLDFAEHHHIEILAYPPHCTHALQGLDVVCFAKMKHAWRDEIDSFEAKYLRGVDKEDFCGVFGQAFKRAFTPDTIKAAFSSTGIWPYDPDVISVEQTRPSEATSTKSSFPQPQSSPTRAVMAAFHNYTFSNLDVNPSPISGSPTSTPSHRKHPLDTASNPDLFTPSKQMRFLGTGLVNTSASFLVTKARVSHLEMKQIIQPPVIESVPDELEAPNWVLANDKTPLKQLSPEELEKKCLELQESLSRARIQFDAQENIIEGQNAQMIIQNMGMEKMNQSLYEKENKKQTDRSVLFPGGKGRHLTSREFIDKKKEVEAAREAEVAGKKARKLSKDQRKEEKAKLEKAWKQIQEDHEKAKAAHKKKCDMLRKRGVKVKDLPKGPGRALKPKSLEELESKDSDESDEEMDDDIEDTTDSEDSRGN